MDNFFYYCLARTYCQVPPKPMHIPEWLLFKDDSDSDLIHAIISTIVYVEVLASHRFLKDLHEARDLIYLYVYGWM